jgi:hypothetical protein
VVEALSVVAMVVKGGLALAEKGEEPGPETLGPLIEMCTLRTIDACITYLSSALTVVFRHRPMMLKSKETVQLEFVMRFENMEDFVHELVERKVHELSRRGLAALNAYCEKTLKFSLFSGDAQRDRATRLVDIRNLVVHNRGIVNRIYKQRHPDSPDEIGSHLNFKGSAGTADVEFLLAWIMDLDVRFIEKFSLPAEPRIPRPGFTLPALPPTQGVQYSMPKTSAQA